MIATVTGGEPGYTYKWTPLTGLDDSSIKTLTLETGCDHHLYGHRN
ncbi:MAG: hypothetical protein R2758_04245 [Bacteroidales bacterium]